MITEKVSTSYKQSEKYGELLGFLPVLDPEYSGCSYYSVENEHPEREFERIVPCYHFNVLDDNWTPAEEWYFKESLPKDSRHDTVLMHEVYRDDFIQRFNTLKYVVRFIGCDDGDKLMRFRDKEHALEYLNNIQSFEDVYDNPYTMDW